MWTTLHFKSLGECLTESLTNYAQFLECINGKVLKCCKVRKMSAFLFVVLLCTCENAPIICDVQQYILRNDNSILISVAASGAFLKYK